MLFYILLIIYDTSEPDYKRIKFIHELEDSAKQKQEISKQNEEDKKNLNNKSKFNNNYVTYVPEISNLAVRYPYVDGNEQVNWSKLELPKEFYNQMHEIGVFVKIMLGYLKIADGKIEDENVTPDRTNVLVPHISYIMQKSRYDLPKLIPSGILRESSESSPIVLLSADQGTPYKDIIAEFYNEIYQNKGKIKILSVDSRSSFGKDHTEHFLIELLNNHPDWVLNFTQEQFKKDYTFLGIIIDCFSWLDACEYCSNYLHDNDCWPAILSRIKDKVCEKKIFTVLDYPINGIIRIFSHAEYKNGLFDLTFAQSNTLSIHALFEKRITLATRIKNNDNTQRDKAVENIQSSMINAALSKPISFWINHPNLFKLLLKNQRPFFLNPLKIIYLANPNNDALLLGISADIDKEKRSDLSRLFKKTNWTSEEKTLLRFFDDYKDTKFPLDELS